MLMLFLLFLVLIIFLLLLENYRELTHFEIKTYEISSSKMKENECLNLVFISDLHNCSYGTNNSSLLDAISSLKPDIILIGGDMITRSDKNSYDKVFPTINALSDIASVYYANGNHEQKLKEFPKEYELCYEKLTSFLRECGIHLLENETSYFHMNNNRISVTGLEIPINGYSYFGSKKIFYEEIEENIGKPQSMESFNILLAHNPMHMPLYRQWKPDLILSGHLHGGIVRIPYLGGVIAPDFIPFPKYSGGFFKEEGINIIVSNGLGTHSIPIRINCPAQLVHIKVTN